MQTGQLDATISFDSVVDHSERTVARISAAFDLLWRGVPPFGPHLSRHVERVAVYTDRREPISHTIVDLRSDEITR